VLKSGGRLAVSNFALKNWLISCGDTT
jgi:hypothetical protein